MNLIARARDAGTAIGSNKEIALLEIQETKNVTYTWIPEKGEHNLNFTIDFKSTGQDMDEGNNHFAETITVNSKEPENAKFICRGIVYQPDGYSPASGAEIRFTNNRTGLKRATTTNNTGHYSFDLSTLPGKYHEGDEIIIYASDGENATSMVFKVYSEDKSRFDNITLVKVSTFALSISVEDGSKKVLPSKKVEYKLTVTNRGNEENDVNLTISDVIDVSTSLPAARWDASLNQYLLNIQPKGSMPVILTVEAPAKNEDARANDQVLVVVTAKSTNDPTQQDLVGMTTTVGRIYNFDITIEEPSLKLDPAINLSRVISVKIKNGGNDDDTVNIGLSSPPEWQADFEDSFDLLLGEEKAINITLTCDESVGAGLNSFKINVTSIDNIGTTYKTFAVEVLRPDLTFFGNISMTPAQPELSSTITFTVEIYNIGTAVANEFKFEFWVSGSQYYYRIMDNLSANQRTRMNVTWIPQNTGKYQLEFILDPQEDLKEINENNNNQTIQIEFFYELEISEPRFTNSGPVEGAKITISVNIKNTGNVKIKKSFTIIFYDGDPTESGRLIGEVTVFQELSVGEEIDKSLDWVAKRPGSHSIFVEVNPNKEIKERDYENNIAQRSITVESKVTVEEDNSMMLIMLVFIIGIVLVVILVLMPSKQAKERRKSKTKPKGKGPGKKVDEEKPKPGKPTKKPKKVATSKDEVKFKVVEEEEALEAEAEVEEKMRVKKELAADEEGVEVEAGEEEIDEGDEEGIVTSVSVGERIGNLISGRWLPMSKTKAKTELEEDAEEEAEEEAVSVDEEIESIEEGELEVEPEMELGVAEDELAEVDVAEVEVIGEEPFDELEAEEVVGIDEEMADELGYDEEYEEVAEVEEEEEVSKKKKKKRKSEPGIDYSHMIGIR